MNTPSRSNFCCFDEIDEFGELLVGLAGKAGDEGGAQDEIGNALTQRAEQRFGIGAIYAALHAAEHRVVDVLQRQIEVGNNFFARRRSRRSIRR